MLGTYKCSGLPLVTTLLAICALGIAGAASAQPANTVPPLKHIQVNLNDTAALRTGAIYFMHQCAACHSLQGLRFQELAKPLNLTDKQMADLIKVSTRRPLDTIVSPMPSKLATSYFGVEPPDLTDEVHLRSVDWLYTYLTSFYVDPTRPTGANNVTFHNVAMPDVFAGLQGLQSPVTKPGILLGQHTEVAVGVKPLTRGSMSPEQFDDLAKDLVTFLDYVGNPHQQESHAIGLWVMVAMAVWIVLTYLVYRLYWRDVARPHGPRWWSYWKKH
ncbi:MAG: cytochrome c1 [Rhodanobacteraceae bacterium]